MTLLQNLHESMQQFAEVLQAAIKLDVDIFDRELNRVAGTGLTRNKIGSKIDVNGIVNRFIYDGENQIVIHNPGVEEKCSACSHFGNCIYKAAVYASIHHQGQILGAMGIIALDDEQKKALDDNQEAMLKLVEKIAELIGSKVSDHILTEQLKMQTIKSDNSITLDNIIGNSPALNEVKDKVSRVSKSNSTVLLSGETGTGKELFSRAIHAESDRAKGPFVALNCAAIPENLIESELFGYEKGAFTGAKKDGKHGKFYLANNGTLFLDEVENMPLYMQQKLLRVIENREVEPLGSDKPKAIDIRIVAASNKNLEEMVMQGTFREDLYHRLNVITIDIPPLRHRGKDVFLLTNHFIAHYNKHMKKNILGISEDCISLFKNYMWPGNVRELQHVIEYAINMETTGYIQANNIPNRLKVDQETDSVLEKVEKSLIEKAIKKYGWTDEGKTLAAKELGISRSSIYRKIKKYNLKKG